MIYHAANRFPDRPAGALPIVLPDIAGHFRYSLPPRSPVERLHRLTLMLTESAGRALASTCKVDVGPGPLHGWCLMLELLPADLADALRDCVTADAFDADRFNTLLADRPGLEKFREQLIDEVYMALVLEIEQRRDRARSLQS